MEPWFATMEATHKVTISLVLPMSCLVIKATDPRNPVTIVDYEDPKHPVTHVIQVMITIDELKWECCKARVLNAGR
jgi:hypothetical protein